MLSTGQVLHNRYRIVKLLGQGGYGAVYRAWDTSLNTRSEVKENFDTSTEAARQFAHEASLLANLRHPNLPRVTNHFFIAGQGQYLAMDFVEGEDLQAMLECTGGHLNPAGWKCNSSQAAVISSSRRSTMGKSMSGSITHSPHLFWT